jgi:hypothetical protein
MSNIIIPGEGGSPLPLPSSAQPVVTSTVPDSAMELPIAETASEAGCYEFIKEEFFVDATDPDPAIVKQIRAEADPRFVPLKCRRIYKSPTGGDVVKTYHVIGRYIPHPQESYADAYVHLHSYPHNFPFPTDKIQPLRTLWAPWEKGSVEDNNNTPPAEVKFSGIVLEQMRALRKAFDTAVSLKTLADGTVSVTNDEYVKDKLRDIMNAEAKRDEREMTAAREEARYRMRHNWGQMKRAIDEDRWSPPPQDSSPKAFVDMGRR